MSDPNDFVNFEGIPFWFKKRYIIVPPLHLKKIRPFDAELGALGEMPADKGPARDAWLEKHTAINERLVTVALRRNYTAAELSDEDIEEFLDYHNLWDAVKAAQGTAHATIRRYRSPGEVNPAEASPSRWTGAISTGASQPDLA